MRALLIVVLMAATAVAADQQSSNPYASTYRAPASRATVIRNATILTAAGPAIERGSILLQNGKVAAVGQTVDRARRTRVVIDATGKWVTPGVIDTHSHLGVYAAPGIESLQDGNEMTSPNTAEVSSGARHLAAGSAVRARPRRRRDDDAHPAGVGRTCSAAAA